MILVWLGSFFLMIYGMQQSQKNMSQLLGFLQKKLFVKSLEGGFWRMLYRVADIAILETSPQQSMQTGLALYNLRVVSKRASVLLMGLSTLGGWWALILGFLFLRLSGVMLLGFCSLMLVSFLQFEKWKIFLKIILYMGLFLLGAELMTRHAAMLQIFLGESDLAFWIADGRLPAIMGIFVLGFFLTLLIEVEFWTLCMGLALLVASTVSFNGALALFAGERCARAVLLYWSGRSLNRDCRLVSLQMGAASFAGAFLGLLAALSLKDLLALTGSLGLEGGADRSWNFMWLVIVILFVQFLAQMVAGHFVAQKVVSEFQEPLYFPKSWLKPGRLSPEAMRWAQGRLGQRIQEIRYHLQGLNTFQAGQIPDHVQARLKAEEAELSRIQSYLQS